MFVFTKIMNYSLATASFLCLHSLSGYLKSEVVFPVSGVIKSQEKLVSKSLLDSYKDSPGALSV